MLQKYCACHTKRRLTRLETCWNATKCHGCHAKWSYATLGSSKNDPVCRTLQNFLKARPYGPHANGCERLRTVANSFGRLRTQTQRPANTALPPHPQSETGTLATDSGTRQTYIDSLSKFLPLATCPPFPSQSRDRERGSKKSLPNLRC